MSVRYSDVIIQEVIKRDMRRLVSCALEHTQARIGSGSIDVQYPALGNRVYGEEDGSLKLESSDEKILIDVSGTDDDILSLLSMFRSHSPGRTSHSSSHS